MSDPAIKDEAIDTMNTTVERVRSENEQVVKQWISRISTGCLKERIAAWRKMNPALPDSQRIKRILIGDEPAT